ncbi:MAG: hypothetical protein IPJ61_17935 [Tessaracoccus sp.]|uniref:hypothetical protein n=1 Tax=Tessaracoccus sp. TaxID=1971211 RepID=UPI001EC6F06A|nr:hypothetical protein [Tessaracoccus sp.]MBK7822877.1 hypothetical protein [Tessaracoccus sp.]
MDFWGWFLLAVVVGGGLLAAAVLADRRARRRESGEGEPAPERGIPAVDSQVPAYITQDEVDALPAPGRGVAGDLSHKGEGFGFGHAHPDFATQTSGADCPNPRILVVDGEIDAMRQLFVPLSTATAEVPLVVVAAGFADDVLTTLAANRRAVGLSVVAAVAGPKDRRRLAELTGAEQLTPEDLRAGYVPEQAFGRAARWTSTLRASWVAPALVR